MKFFDAREKTIIRICIDDRPGGGLSGRIAAPLLAHEEQFSDAGDMLLLVEAYLDASNGPQAFQRGRTFGGKKRVVEAVEVPNDDAHDARGKIATCAVRVTTRQNATWQGYADMGDGSDAIFFASALELLFYIEGKLHG